jgi:hypothetical protein
MALCCVLLVGVPWLSVCLACGYALPLFEKSKIWPGLAPQVPKKQKGLPKTIEKAR